METKFNVENPPAKREKIIGKIIPLCKNKVQELFRNNNESGERGREGVEVNYTEVRSQLGLLPS